MDLFITVSGVMLLPCVCMPMPVLSSCVYLGKIKEKHMQQISQIHAYCLF